MKIKMQPIYFMRNLKVKQFLMNYKLILHDINGIILVNDQVVESNILVQSIIYNLKVISNYIQSILLPKEIKNKRKKKMIQLQYLKYMQTVINDITKYKRNKIVNI